MIDITSRYRPRHNTWMSANLTPGPGFQVFKASRRAVYWLWLASSVGLSVLVFFLALTAAEADLDPQQSTVLRRHLFAPQTPAPDPCGLKDVVCPEEAASASVANQAKPQRVIQATVYTYQAVPEQTDTTPCVGAMPGVDFCDPPFPIVANNCLPLGTKVLINGRERVVADRMNPRHDCDVFDLLTNGTNFTLINEPVTVL